MSTKGDDTGNGGESSTAQVPAAGSLDVRTIRFELVVPNLRNGALAEIQQAAVRAGMQALYYWPAISGLGAADAVNAAEHSFRAHVASLTLGRGTAAIADADIRKWAVVLAGVRSGAQAAWRLQEGDMTMKEVVSSGMEVMGGRVSTATTGGTASSKWAAARSVEDMSAVEMDALAMCAYMGMAVPVLQGASLVSTGHHYVPTTYGLFAGLKKQALGASSREVSAWVESMGERFDDLAFHKACHPISPDLKRELAIMPETGSKLAASGHGSAAIRLPAIPSEASGGKAAIALVKHADQTIRSMRGSISANTGIRLLKELEEAAPGAPRARACDAVVEWISKNEKVLALCAGIVQQIHESTSTGTNTLLRAYSVKKLVAAHPSEVSRGVNLARSAAMRDRAAMEEGTYEVGNLEL
jgi:hypothetical protein